MGVVFGTIQVSIVVRHKGISLWSETTLNYWMMVERYPNPKEEVGGSNLGCEISSLLDKILVRWSTATCSLALACRTSISE